MNDSVSVTDRDGLHGTIEPAQQAVDALPQRVRVQMADGRVVLVPGELFERRSAQDYYLPISLADLVGQEGAGAGTALTEGGEVVIPVVEERLDVARRSVPKGGVRVTKRVRQHEEVVDEPGFTEDVQVERVPINRTLDGPAEVRREGDTIIVPVLEEVLVVEKRLVLKEELRITRRRRAVSQPHHVTLRSEEVSVERFAGSEQHEVDVRAEGRSEEDRNA